MWSRLPVSRELKDVVFEDVVFDKNSYCKVLNPYLDLS